MSQPILITVDPDLLDHVLQLAAAAGTDIRVCATVEHEPWRVAPLVLVGEDCLGSVAQASPARRSDVVVVGHVDPFADEADIPNSVWRDSVAVGAGHVVRLPEADRWLIDRLAESVDGPASGGPVISVMGGTGGAGATTVAQALAASTPDSLLVDVDPYWSNGSTVDGALQWRDLSATRGRIPPNTLRDSLPEYGRGRLLAGMPEHFDPEPVHAVLEAGARGFALTVVDVPRAPSPVVRAALSRSDLVAVVVGPEQHRAAMADVVIRSLCDAGHRVLVVPRVGPGTIAGWHLELSSFLGVEVTTPLRHDRALARGESPTYAASRSLRQVTTAIRQTISPAGHRRRGAA